jgi:large conductance mechanosensitive channel
MLKEFKAFIMRGNVVDLAVGVIIGAAFGSIVKSLVEDVLMPPLGLLIGKVDFSTLFVPLAPIPVKIDEVTKLPIIDEVTKLPVHVTMTPDVLKGFPAIRYGLFLNNVINFLIVAFAIFILIKLISRLMPPAPPPPPATKDCPQCCMAVPIKAVKCGHCQSAL